MRSLKCEARVLLTLFTIPMATIAAQASTADGVYNRQQALRGQDIYAGQCRSCHTPESHTGAMFNATWSGRPLGDLYAFIRDRMPKNTPGSLSPQENADVTAYLLRLNRMPTGVRELPADSVLLSAIRIANPSTPRPVRKDP